MARNDAEAGHYLSLRLPGLGGDRGCSQKLLDPFRFVESLVDAKSDLRCKFEVNAPGDLAANVAAVALQRAEYLLFVAAAERHDINRRQPQVGGDADFGYRDHVMFDHRIMDLPAREQF